MSASIKRRALLEETVPAWERRQYSCHPVDLAIANDWGNQLKRHNDLEEFLFRLMM